MKSLMNIQIYNSNFIEVEISIFHLIFKILNKNTIKNRK